MKAHGIYWTKGNSKVKFPILNLASGTDCSSAAWCPFSRVSRTRGSGRALCYAQKAELVWPSVLQARRENARIIATLADNPARMAQVAADLAADIAPVARKAGGIVRLNEAGDIGPQNIEFAAAFVRAIGSLGIRVYLYTKAAPQFADILRKAGATVLVSERDFVAVRTRAEGAATGLAECPGICGPCTRCPDGLKSWILEH